LCQFMKWYLIHGVYLPSFVIFAGPNRLALNSFP
jgi:hypothetical protein